MSHVYRYLEFGSDGRFARKGIWVEKDARTGRPIAAQASDLNAAARHFGLKDPKVTLVPPKSRSTATIDVSLFNVNMEVAALKATLLTFDHLLARDSNRFTRDSKLEPVREFVRRFILDRKIDVPLYEKIVAGLQYDKLRELYRLRAAVATPLSAFEHVIIAAANPATRTLDVLWWVATVDPYGFRLCQDWDGPPFTKIVVSGVVKGTETTLDSVTKEFACKMDLSRRSLQGIKTPPRQVEQIAKEISTYHRDARLRAIDYAERNCPDFVRDCVLWHAKLGLQEAGDGRIARALKSYLELLFEWRLGDQEKRKVFDDIVNRNFAAADQSLMLEAISIEAPVRIKWHRWHTIYVSILNDLAGDLGLPGEVSGGQVVLDIPIESNKRDNL